MRSTAGSPNYGTQEILVNRLCYTWGYPARLQGGLRFFEMDEFDHEPGIAGFSRGFVGTLEFYTLDVSEVRLSKVGVGKGYGFASNWAGWPVSLST
jgi:hypothetical protein